MQGIIDRSYMYYSYTTAPSTDPIEIVILYIVSNYTCTTSGLSIQGSLMQARPSLIAVHDLGGILVIMTLWDSIQGHEINNHASLVIVLQ